jgi:hypothetical protein
VTISEGLALAGVVFAAGAAIERLRRYEGSAKAQYKRIGDALGEVAELRGQVRVLLAVVTDGRGVVTGPVPSNQITPGESPPPARAMGAPPPPRK